jgi:glucose/arabinose dehydrogenase
MEDRSLPSANIGLETIVSGLTGGPLLATNAADGTNRLFVVEQNGRISVRQPNGTLSTFLDLSPGGANRVRSPFGAGGGNEQGLLGLAFHPDYETNGRFFVHYTTNTLGSASNGVNRVSEFRVSAGNPNVADPASEQVVLQFPAQPFGNHNGGSIEFGPDGFLYIAKGDGGSGNDPGNRAQNRGNDSNVDLAGDANSPGWFGKILRIDVGGGATRPDSFPTDPNRNYAIPAAQQGQVGRDEIFAFGLRNPYRISFDTGPGGTGALYVGDVGQDFREEINIVTFGGNYGWRPFEGDEATPGIGQAERDAIAATAIFPIVDLRQDNPAPTIARSITGGYTYRGSQGTLPQGSYLFGDFIAGRVFLYEDGLTTQIGSGQTQLTSFGRDEAGELYVIRFTGGSVSRVTFAATPLAGGGFSDPGFEIPNVGAGSFNAFQYNPPSAPAGVPANTGVAGAGTPWGFAGSAGVAGNGSGFTVGNPNAPTGTQVAFVQNDGRVFQSLSLSAGSYTLSFQAAQRGNSNPGGPQTVRVFLDGTALGDFTPDGTAYQTFAVNFTVGQGAKTVTFQGLGSGDSTALLDNVQVAVFVPPATGNIPGGGFEAPAVGAGNFQYNPPVVAGGNPWTFSAASGVSGNGSGFTAGNPNAPDGTQVAFLQNAGTITQSVSLAPGTYTLSFQAAQRGNFNPGGNQTIRVLVNGVSVGEFTPSGAAYQSFTTAAFSAGPAAGTTITFQGLGSGDSTALIDDVRAVAPSALANRGFEAPGVGAGNFQYNPGGAAWTFTALSGGNGSGVSGNGSGFTSGNPNAPEGGQVAFLQGTGSATQVVNGLAAGNYTVSFRAAQRGNFNPGGPQAVRVLVDGVVRGTFTPAGAGYELFTTASFALSAGAHTLRLEGFDVGGDGGDATALVDDVVFAALA